MNKITSRTRLAENVYALSVEAPEIARERKAGQFVIVMADAEKGERIPLTICDADPARGTIDLLFQTAGATTMQLAAMKPGDGIVVAGPLGRPTRIRGTDGTAPGRVVCVGGGIGAAPVHPIVQALAAAGNRVTVIVGARTKSLIVMEEKLRKAAGGDLIVVTDDGSAGRKGLVTEPLKELCEGGGIDEVIAIGPPVMMKFCAATTRPFGVKTTVSLNTIMIDGTGMCGGCRVSVGGKTRFVCVDGPEFDGHEVDWDQMMQRMGAFREQEAAAREHACRLFGGLAAG